MARHSRKDPVCLTLVIHDPSGPIRGSVSERGRPAKSFWGWLQLVDLLEARRKDASQKTGTGA